MEVKREKLAIAPAGTDLSKEDFRIRQLRARDMLRGDLGDDGSREVRRGARADDDARQGRRLGALQRPLPGHVRPCLLRDRDDVDRRRARRHRALRLRGLPRLAASGRPADPLRPRLDQDGAGRAAHLRPDARAEVGDRDGRLLELDGRLQQLRDRARRQVHAGRRPRAGLPAAARRRSCTGSSSCAR